MNLLLDTHVLIWWDSGMPLSNEAQRAIHDADMVFVSAATAWEVEIKRALGRAVGSRRVDEAVVASGFRELPVLFRHTQRLQGLPPVHRDPFDRLLIAQAQDEGLTIVTRDAQFRDYEVPTIAA